MKVSADSRVGYTLEVDLEYPSELHDDHNCYPLAPEHKIVQDEELSPFSQQLWEELNAVDGLKMRLLSTIEIYNFIYHLEWTLPKYTEY